MSILKFLKNNKGFTILELVLVLVIAAAVIGGALYLYSRTQTSSWVQGTAEKAIQTMAMIDHVKALRGGDLPAQASAVPLSSSSSPFASYVGSDTGDLSNITYQCVAATPGSVVVTVNSTGAPTTSAIDAVRDIIVAKLTTPKYTVGTVSGGAFTITTPVPSCS